MKESVEKVRNFITKELPQGSRSFLESINRFSDRLFFSGAEAPLMAGSSYLSLSGASWALDQFNKGKVMEGATITLISIFSAAVTGALGVEIYATYRLHKLRHSSPSTP